MFKLIGKLLCGLGHCKWEWIHSEINKGFTDRVWKCTRCSKSVIEKVWHDI